MTWRRAPARLLVDGVLDGEAWLRRPLSKGEEELVGLLAFARDVDRSREEDECQVRGTRCGGRKSSSYSGG